MTTFDVCALGVIALSIVVSMMRGLVAEVASLITVVVAFTVARVFSPVVADIAFASMSPHALAVVMAFMLLFVAAWVVQRLLRSALTSALSSMGLGGVNKLLGAAFGAIRGILLVTLAVLVCAFTDLPHTPSWQQSQTAFVFEALAQLAVPYLPPFMADKVQYPPA